jgi:hypothetical protein
MLLWYLSHIKPSTVVDLGTEWDVMEPRITITIGQLTEIYESMISNHSIKGFDIYLMYQIIMGQISGVDSHSECIWRYLYKCLILVVPIS